MNNPAKFRSPNTKWEFNVDKANALLDAAGWKKGADGIREKGRQEDEVRLPDVDQRHPAEGAGDRQAGGAEGRASTSS
jgi:ABC-type transport system substrate-binding protein